MPGTGTVGDAQGIVYVQDGHVFEIDEDGYRKTWDSSEYHSGPWCLICENIWCEHCSPGIFKEKCPERFETLDGLEYPQPPPPPPKGTIIARRI